MTNYFLISKYVTSSLLISLTIKLKLSISINNSHLNPSWSPKLYKQMLYVVWLAPSHALHRTRETLKTGRLVIIDKGN